IKIIGHNYVQEAENTAYSLPSDVKCHFIGHLQKNKINKALKLFDVIETVDTVDLAIEIDQRAKLIGKQISIFIEVNSALESNKSGANPSDIEEIIKRSASLFF
ncbi:MAG: alanine racemase, partial [Candidatus Omnitrophica bacterium]|nr:alanine racemase [Candidatus Omnitrophota bacterium]